MLEKCLVLKQYSDGKKIQAIKALRANFRRVDGRLWGLKEAKEICDKVDQLGEYVLPENDLSRFFGMSAEEACFALNNTYEWTTAVEMREWNNGGLKKIPEVHDTPVYMMVAVRPEDNEAIAALTEEASCDELVDSLTLNLNDPEHLRRLAALAIDRMERFRPGSTFRAPIIND